MNFAYSDKVEALRRQLLAFMDEHVYPNELREHEEIAMSRSHRTAAVLLLAALLAPDARAVTKIFLDRCAETCSYTPGADDARTNASSVVSGTSVLSAFAWGDASWDAVVDCVRTAFAPFDAVVTDADPGSGEHLEIAVAGTPQQIGLSVASGTSRRSRARATASSRTASASRSRIPSATYRSRSAGARRRRRGRCSGSIACCSPAT